MRSRGRLECEESGRSASVVPRKRRRSNLKTMRTGATRVWMSLLWTSFRAMERGGRPSLGSSIRRFEFLFFLKAVGVSPFCSSHFKLSGEGRACNHEAAVPVAQALREERTHGRSRALWEEFVKPTQVSSYPPSWEAGKDFAQPRCTPPISVHEVPLNALCSRRVVILVLCGRAAVCLRLPSLA